MAAQLAGLLVLAACGARSAAPDHPMLVAAERTFDEASEAMQRRRPSPRARRHHRHVLDAAKALAHALGEMRESFGPAGRLDMDRILVPLRAGYNALQHAADALPGFELVSFERGCCAVGATPRPIDDATMRSAAHRGLGRR